MDTNIALRMAKKEDSEALCKYSVMLGEYQKMTPDKLPISKEHMESMISNRVMEAIVAEDKGRIIGIALFYHMPNGFSGKTIIFLNVFYVEEAYRKHGVGKMLFRYLSQLAVERQAERIELLCLRWNEPGMSFYAKVGMDEMEPIVTWRMPLASIEKFLAEE